ncbi:MAG: M28 family peptidase [Gemmatimonadetes bacterium]|nr:M28 family peptidase [Gemmatimonadota bacterium]
MSEAAVPSRSAYPASLLLALALSVLGSACAEERSAISVDDAVARLTPELIRDRVAVLAHDSMRGRDTDDVGYEKARDWAVGEMQRIGLEPAFDGEYLQPFDLLEAVSDDGSRLVVGGIVLTPPDVIVEPDWTGAAVQRTGPAVWIGHALVAADADVPDLDGRIAFIEAGAPAGREDEPEIAMRERAHVELALSAGAAAVVVLDPQGDEQAWQRQATAGRPIRVLANGTAPYPRAQARVGPAASRRLIDALAGGTPPVTLEPRHTLRTLRSWNVGGRWPGTESARADEAVVFTAHLDHVGIGAPDAEGDSVFNGTHDNALGVGKLLAAAEALRGARLPRSVLFLLTGAEEWGLLGAWHYVNHPAVPMERTVAAINHDGGLVDVRTDDVFAWGPEFSSVEADVERAARESGLVLAREKRAPFAPSAGLLYRSDHYPFLIAGVPVVYLMPGFTVDGDPDAGRRRWETYLARTHHRQADDFDASASYEGPVALTALSVRLAWDLAEAEGMPITHADAPVRRRRGPPSGFFFGEGVR